MSQSQHIRVQTTDKGFDYWLSKEFLTPTLRQKLTEADALLIPHERHGDVNILYFADGTEDFFQFLATYPSTKIKVDLCIDDNEYKELVLHSDILNLPNILLTIVALPLLVNMITEYVKHKVGSREDKTTLKIELTVTDKNRKLSKKLKYEGSASDFQKLGDTLKSITSVEELDELASTEDGEYSNRINRLMSHKGDKNDVD